MKSPKNRHLQVVVGTTFYFSSDVENKTVEFHLEMEGEPPPTKAGWEQLARAFTKVIDTFGKTVAFPNEIVEHINGDCRRLDRLLEDTEFIPERTYYLILPSNQLFYSKINNEIYRMRGINEMYCLFETLDIAIVDVVKIQDAMKVFGKVW